VTSLFCDLVGFTAAEARGDVLAAAEGFRDAAARWGSFGVVPEQAFALLGQGRCGITVGRIDEATAALLDARNLFTACEMRPSVEEVDVLIGSATSLTS